MSETVEFPSTDVARVGMLFNLFDSSFSPHSIYKQTPEVARQHLYRESFNSEVVESTQQALEVIGVSPWLRLGARPAGVGADGGASRGTAPRLAASLKLQNSHTDTSVNVVGRFEYITEVHSLPVKAQLRDNWQQTARDCLATHYVTSVTYGARAVFLLSFTVEEQLKKSDVKVDFALPTSVAGAAGANVERSLQTNFRSRECRVQYWAEPDTSRGSPTNLEQLNRHLSELKSRAVEEAVPLRVKIDSLHHLDRSFTLHRVPVTETLNRLLEDRDELLTVQSGCSDLLEEVMEHTGSSEHETEVENLSQQVYTVLQVYDSVLCELRPDQDVLAASQRAVDAYTSASGGKYIRHHYTARLKQLRQQLKMFFSGPRLRMCIWYDEMASLLWLLVYELAGLSDKDHGLRADSSRPDAYLVISVTSHDRSLLNKLTKVKEWNSSSPVFNATFFCSCCREQLSSAVLAVKVMDYDSFSRDDVIGEVQVPLASDLRAKRGLGRWYHLQN